MFCAWHGLQSSRSPRSPARSCALVQRHRSRLCSTLVAPSRRLRRLGCAGDKRSRAPRSVAHRAAVRSDWSARTVRPAAAVVSRGGEVLRCLAKPLLAHGAGAEKRGTEMMRGNAEGDNHKRQSDDTQRRGREEADGIEDDGTTHDRMTANTRATRTQQLRNNADDDGAIMRSAATKTK